VYECEYTFPVRICFLAFFLILSSFELSLQSPVTFCTYSILSTIFPICDGNDPFLTDLILGTKVQKIFQQAIFVKFSILCMFENQIQEVSIKWVTPVRLLTRPSVWNNSTPTGWTFKKFWSKCELISGVRREVHETCALLGYYAAQSGNSVPTSRSPRLLGLLEHWRWEG
jgi:hypothetical protein